MADWQKNLHGAIFRHVENLSCFYHHTGKKRKLQVSFPFFGKITGDSTATGQRVVDFAAWNGYNEENAGR
ncbi:MAG: hypothetical protein SOV46_00450 [Candidatus Faecousia sp.]|nr:hypothetical protein [Candidatus Faecousia sp.]